MIFNQLPISNSTASKSHDFHGAAIIDESGNEIFITETMVQAACGAILEQEEAGIHAIKP